MRFVIWSLDYTWRFGGVVVLHKLADLLADAGYETYSVAALSTPSNRAILISAAEAARLAQDSNTVVIYPEIVVGNPLGAVNVARWVLYYPGVNGGEAVYADSEFIFTFNSIFVKDTKYSAAPQIRIIETMREHFFDMGRPRTKDAILVKKGESTFEERARHYLKPYSNQLFEPVSVDEMIGRCKNLAEFNEALNEIRCFISFDSTTYHNVIAVLAGCVSIVVPLADQSREEYFAGHPGLRHGVAYGLDDLAHQSQTKNLLLEGLEKVDSENVEAVARLVSAISQHFGITG